jgi:hypothetical protein
VGQFVGYLIEKLEVAAAFLPLTGARKGVSATPGLAHHAEQ